MTPEQETHIALGTPHDWEYLSHGRDTNSSQYATCRICKICFYKESQDSIWSHSWLMSRNQNGEEILKQYYHAIEEYKRFKV